MDVGCSLQGFEASTMTLQHHSDSDIPYLYFPKIHPSTPTFRGISV